ncbi:MAG TPA: type II secretion system protein [Anaerolineales bacterium]|nr:type II secretion system protein [Anaerolineales bacterium]
MVRAAGVRWGILRRRSTVAKVQDGQEGFSLPEELVSLAILAFALGIVLATIYTGTLGVKANQDRVSGSALARSQLELVMDTGYRADPTAVPYPTVAPQTGYNVSTAVEYWTAPNGPFTSTVRNDGLQRISVTVTGAAGDVLQIESYKVNR